MAEAELQNRCELIACKLKDLFDNLVGAIVVAFSLYPNRLSVESAAIKNCGIEARWHGQDLIGAYAESVSSR
jgi:hypothetical protein